MSNHSFGTLYLHDRVARWRAGDREAADELLCAAGKRLETMARRMLRDFPAVRRWVETNDVLQEASLRLLTALRRVLPGSMREFFGLSALQIRRELLTLSRAARRRPGGLEHAEAVVDGRSSEAADLELWRRFHEEVEKLPGEQREVVGLLLYHDWTQKQAAELLGVDERTIRRYRVAALARLLDVLGGQLPKVERLKSRRCRRS